MHVPSEMRSSLQKQLIYIHHYHNSEPAGSKMQDGKGRDSSRGQKTENKMLDWVAKYTWEDIIIARQHAQMNCMCGKYWTVA